MVGLQVECLPDQSIFWLIGDLSLCVPLFKFKDAGVLHQMLQHFQRLNVGQVPHAFTLPSPLVVFKSTCHVHVVDV